MVTALTEGLMTHTSDKTAVITGKALIESQIAIDGRRYGSVYTATVQYCTRVLAVSSTRAGKAIQRTHDRWKLDLVHLISYTTKYW